MTHYPEMQLLLESFKRNGRVNEAVLEAMTEADLSVSDGQDGWNIGQHLGHLAEFRHGWLSYISPKHAEGIPVVLEGDEPNIRLTAKNLDELKQAFSAGDEAALKAAFAALEEGRSFQGAYESHPAHFLQHTLVHDAHHRGQVMSLLRRSGRSFQQMDALESATWPIWRE